MRLPTSFEELAVLDPGWDTDAQYADGVYLAAGEHDGVLEFTSVDVHGRVLWAVQRPASCTGFAVTTDADGRALAVLGDLQTSSDALAATTASAYDLTTGEHVWGPVEVRGPYQGPGLVFAAPPEGFMGETGPRVALDPTTTLAGEDRTALIAQVATDARTGSLGIANICAPGAPCTPSELDDQAGRSVLADGGLELYHPLWEEAAEGDELIPTRGCSVPTFHGSAADLAAVAATLVNMIGLHLQQAETPVSGTHLIALPHAPTGPRHHFLPAASDSRE